MKNNFDIKKFLIENKVTLNSKNISEQDNFELGDTDIELAKQLNVKYLKIGDTIEPEMWDQKSDAIRELYYIDTNKPYKITGFLEDWDGAEDMDGEAAQYVTLQDSNNKEEYEAVYWVKQALKPQFQLEVEPLDESFELGDNDINLAKGLDFIKVRFTRQDEADELNDMYDEMGGENGMTPEQVLVMDADNLNAEGYFENEYESLEAIAQEIVPVLGGTVDKWIEALEEMVDLDIIEIYK